VLRKKPSVARREARAAQGGGNRDFPQSGAKATMSATKTLPCDWEKQKDQKIVADTAPGSTQPNPGRSAHRVRTWFIVRKRDSPDCESGPMDSLADGLDAQNRGGICFAKSRCDLAGGGRHSATQKDMSSSRLMFPDNSGHFKREWTKNSTRKWMGPPPARGRFPLPRRATPAFEFSKEGILPGGRPVKNRCDVPRLLFKQRGRDLSRSSI